MPRQLSVLKDSLINEASGLACSYNNSEGFWTHNDSGDGANLFLINMKGETLRSGLLEDASARDWEDIASFQLNDMSYLLVADVGDNASNREEYQLYLLKEPRDAHPGRVRNHFQIEKKIRFRYEDGSHNCESIAVDTAERKIYLVSKKGGNECKVYELPLTLDANQELFVAKAIADLKIPTAVAMDISADGKRTIILSRKNEAYEFTRHESESWTEAFTHEPKRLIMPSMKQGEAICYGQDGYNLYLVSEHAYQPLWEVKTAVKSNIGAIRFGSLDGPLDGLSISWKGAGENDSISWGYTHSLEVGSYKGTLGNSIIGTQFDYLFPILIADTTIYYELFDSKDEIWTGLRMFKTASGASNDKYSFTVLGDSRSYPEEWGTISKAPFDTDFTLFMGDIINNGAIKSDWNNWFEYGEKFISNEPIYHCLGNHDRDNSSSRFETYLDLFTLPGNELYYSFNYGNAVFICLNTEMAKDTNQYEWLLSTLELNKNQIWKIVFFHKPFYTAPSHAGEMDEYFDTWWKAFDDFGVDVIFNGHTHNYQRTKPINRNISKISSVSKYGSSKEMGRCQIVAGNAGAPLNDAAGKEKWWLDNSASLRHFCNIIIEGKRLSLKAMDANHTVIDSLIIDKSENTKNK